MTGETTEIRSEYPFQISYEDARLRGSLVCLRAESAEALGAALLDVQLALSGALGEEDVPPPTSIEEEGRSVPGAPPPQASDSVPTLPMEALQALMAQNKQLPCDCKAGWWDNRASKKSPKYPDFKCKKCGKGVWLTAYQEG